jgi:hypothetical protein
VCKKCPISYYGPADKDKFMRESCKSMKFGTHLENSILAIGPSQISLTTKMAAIFKMVTHYD